MLEWKKGVSNFCSRGGIEIEKVPFPSFQQPDQNGTALVSISYLHHHFEATLHNPPLPHTPHKVPTLTCGDISKLPSPLYTTTHNHTFYQMSDKQNEDKPKVLVTLEEDDEFEDFPVEGE